MPRRRKDKIDANQPDIVKKLREIDGVTVELGMDDILIGYEGVNYWIEIKDPERSQNKAGHFKKGEIKPHQAWLDENWTGQYSICTTLEQILETIGIKE